MKTCTHLAALKEELERKGVSLDNGGPSPYGKEWGT